MTEIKRREAKMILVADSQCTTAEEVKKHVKELPSVEDLAEAIDFGRMYPERWMYPERFYDYPSMIIPEKRKPLVNADQLIGCEI